MENGKETGEKEWTGAAKQQLLRIRLLRSNEPKEGMFAHTVCMQNYVARRLPSPHRHEFERKFTTGPSVPKQALDCSSFLSIPVDTTMSSKDVWLISLCSSHH